MTFLIRAAARVIFSLPMAVLSPLPGPERRLVSVLFADLVGFTTLSERLDPEDVATIQYAYFERARAAVEDAGGVVEKFIGDAVVATFGVPHASEHDGSGRSGPDWRSSPLSRRSPKACTCRPGSLQVRVGVNTGEVHASPGADGAWRLTGNVMNVAARLQAAADRARCSSAPGPPSPPNRTSCWIRRRSRVQGKVRAGVRLAGRRPAGRAVARWAPPRFRRSHARQGPELAPLLGSLTEPLDARRGPPRGWSSGRRGWARPAWSTSWQARARQAGHPVWRATVSGHGDPYDVARALLQRGARPRRRAERRSGPRLSPAWPTRGWSGTRCELAADHSLALLQG